MSLLYGFHPMYNHKNHTMQCNITDKSCSWIGIAIALNIDKVRESKMNVHVILNSNIWMSNKSMVM